jgi:hypothetical protein
MKVSIDTILGSAKRLRGEMHADDRSRSGRSQDVRSDSVTIEGRVNTRIDSIQGESRDLQSSLTRNQIISDGINRLVEDIAHGGVNRELILDETRFEGRQVLRDFLGGDTSSDALTAGRNRVNDLIGADVGRLRRLQVEAENIVASKIPGSESAAAIVGNLESSLAGRDAGAIDNMTSLNPDQVRRLVR